MEVHVVLLQHILRQLACDIVDLGPQTLNRDVQEMLI